MNFHFKELLFIFLLPAFSIASNKINKVGNGGNIVQCLGTANAKPVLLDFYEASMNPESAESSAIEIAKKNLLRLKAAAPKLGEQYLNRLDTILADIDFRSDIEILDVSDSKHFFKPIGDNCKAVQIAVRNNRALDNEKKFLIRKDLWEKLAPVQQAGLLTHEIIYEHLSKLGDETSINTRKINSNLYAESLTSKEFWSLIKELRVPIYP